MNRGESTVMQLLCITVPNGRMRTTVTLEDEVAIALGGCAQRKGWRLQQP